MDRFETKALYNYNLKPIILKRFIDDIFMICTHGVDQLHLFFDYLYSIHDTIKFTMEFSRDTINFLDTIVKVSSNSTLHDFSNFLDTTVKVSTNSTLYTKPTKTHLYLLYESAHTDTAKKSNIYDQFLRLRFRCQELQPTNLLSISLKGFPSYTHEQT